MTRTTSTITAKTWDEIRDGEVDAQHAIGRARFTTEWAGDITGSSTCWLLICYVDGAADKPETLVGPYAGYELVEATIAGRRGTFVLAATGRHSSSVARTEVEIVAGSGTGELAGITGSGSYAADPMEYIVTLDYKL
jgi:hypothetical protein